MRGYLVLILAAVHLDYVPSLFGWFDGRGALWVSEAEGFFFISGMVVAMMRHRDIQRAGFVIAVRRSWRRAAQLYVVACTLTLLYTALGQFARSRGWPGVKVGLDTHSSWWGVVVHTLTLRYVYGWADFLTFYVPMFLAAPLIVWALMHHLDAVIVAVSFAAYASLTWRPWGVAAPFLQWQACFVLGCVVGFHFHDIRAWAAALTRRSRIILAALAVGAALAIYTVGLVMLFRAIWQPTTPLYSELVANNRLGLLRPVLCVITFAGGYVALEYLQRPIMATVGRILVLFGQNSLYVYVVQSLFVFTVPFLLHRRGVVFNTTLDLCIIAIIWLGLRKRILLRFMPR